jgi:protein-S-isoprenylcysteine O-methyltransferase Ste14
MLGDFVYCASSTFEPCFLGALITYVGIRGVFARRTKGTEKVVRRVDTRDRSLVFAVFVGSMVLPLLYLFTRWLAFADYLLPAFASWCGTILAGTALWLFWRSHADLGENWSITLEMRKGHQLVTHGVYRSIRHPMYAALWLFGLAQGLLLQNWLAGWSAFVAFAVLYFVRIPREEQMMGEFFGEEYRVYMEKTGRLFPRLVVKNNA